ncbi:MAG TPA: hypothetical protein VD886_08355, partial [Herpetosiphonaceae bacterium]|nr:hypothetical protein [Herpetosiphonaceae bacterium]
MRHLLLNGGMRRCFQIASATLVLAFAIPWWPAPATAAPLASIVVNSASGTTDSNSGTCTLTEAINMANSTQNPPSNGCAQGSLGGADTITFSVSGVIRPSSTLNIISSVTLVGPITLSGNNASRIFTVSSNGSLSLRTLTLQDGNSGGGGAILSNQGTVVADRVTFRNNVGSSEGGAINSSGTLRITDSTFDNNRTTGSNGGAIAHSGSMPLVINKSTFTNNTALQNGGALYNTGSNTLILNTTFTDNRATGDAGRGGGAITNFTNGVMAIGRSHFAENSSPDGNGGAIFNALQTTLTITSSSFLDNAAGTAAATNRYGGAVHSMGGLTIADSSLVAN